MEIKKNDCFIVSIEDMSEDGSGIGKLDGYIWFIKDAVKVISEKMETEKEIQTMIASKKLEFEIMSMIPFGMIGYMKLTFGDFLKVLYGNPAGIIVMSICLALYFTAYIWGRKMIKIEV